MVLIVLGLLGLSSASVALLVYELKSAPEAYEDCNGFHIVGKPMTGWKTAILETRPVGSVRPEEPVEVEEKRSRQATRKLDQVASAAE